MSPEAVIANAQNEYAESALGQIDRWMAAQQPQAFRACSMRRDVYTGVYIVAFEVGRTNGITRGMAEDLSLEEATRRALKDVIAQGESM